MWQGTVASINITSDSGEKMESVREARAVAGKGLKGDRYFKGEGDTWEDPGKELTLIEAEAVDALASESGVKLEYGDARRNVVTRGVPLNHLVGKEFLVGSVRLRGIRLNEPCAHLAELTERKVLSGLVHRGGLRAQILNDGTIQVSDAVQLA